jgi:outer membrane receptor protein involved in Fe transport
MRTTVRAGGRHATLTRTLPLSPDFGSTGVRSLRTAEGGVTTQADFNATILPIERLSIGASVDLGAIDSRYYSNADGGARTLDAQGDGRRVATSAFAHLANSPRDWLRWTLGLRVDYLDDSFSPEGGTSDVDASHFAFSPKAGLNVRYAPAGHAWLSASRTFKAPTLDQLFDQRPIPVPFPPFTLTTSNPDLDPQRGTSIELGMYHDVMLAPARLGLTLTLYQIAMKDELDFDVQALKYVNIARSRHRGTEAGLTFARGITSGFVSLTLQSATSQAGANTGKQLKAIPGQLYSTGVTVSPPRLGTLSLSLTRAADMFIDDANTRRVSSWTRVDAQFSRPIGSVALMLGARNLLDARINSTAFLDPSGSGEAYYYPAAGRVITLGVRHGR